MDSIKKIAHRGIFNNKNIPENSKKAFKKAITYKIPIELDVQLTKDNILVVFHDANLLRMTGKNALLQDLNYKDIKNLTLLETDEKIPTLKEVLELVKGKVLLNIEIKNTKRIKETCHILMKELEDYKPFILQSFHPSIIRFLKQNYKDSEVGLLITDHYPNKMYDFFSTSSFILNYCKPDFLSVSKKLLKEKRIKNLCKRYPILVWTIKDKKEMNNENFTYICNNLPY